MPNVVLADKAKAVDEKVKQIILLNSLLVPYYLPSQK